MTQAASFSPTQNYLTDAGAFTNSASYYGTFDQSGNVYEWNELTGASGSSREIRGGSWGVSSTFVSSSIRYSQATSYEGSDVGFRLASPASVPEPSTCAMTLAGFVCGAYWMWRRRRGSTM